MSDSGLSHSGSWRSGAAFNSKPHAYDPVAHPELFAGVLARRIVACVVDLFVITIPVMLAAIVIFVFGLFTLGLGWGLFWLISPGWIVWALIYFGITLGGPASATVGMRAMDIEMRTWSGAPAYFVLGTVHAVLFWLSISALSPFILVVGLFNTRRRLLHDMVLGTLVINNPARAAALAPRALASNGR